MLYFSYISYVFVLSFPLNYLPCFNGDNIESLQLIVKTRTYSNLGQSVSVIKVRNTDLGFTHAFGDLSINLCKLCFELIM